MILLIIAKYNMIWYNMNDVCTNADLYKNHQGWKKDVG